MESLKLSLRSYVNRKHNQQDHQDDELQLTEEYYRDLKGVGNPKAQAIPPFFQPRPNQDILFQKVREQSRAEFLELRTNELLDSTELDTLWQILSENSMGTADDKYIDYTTFCKIRQILAPRFRQYLSPVIYGRLVKISNPPSPLVLFNYVMRKMWINQSLIGLSLYDSRGDGYLTAGDLEGYIGELVPTLCQLDDMPPAFVPIYLFTAISKFFFFLGRREVVKLTDIISCGFLEDFLALRSEVTPDINWFTEFNVRRVHEQFLYLDQDRNGMLSRREFAGINGGFFTGTFIDRLFDVVVTYNGEMDYKNYLDFVLASENRAEERSLVYFFKIFDVEGGGCLTDFTINYFYKDIAQQVGSIPVEHVCDELFDMMQAGESRRITLPHVLQSGQGDVLFSLLSDVSEFVRFDNREVSAVEEDYE